MSAVQVVALDEARLTYFRERLAGGLALSRLFLNVRDLNEGHVWAWLPDGKTAAPDLNLGAGGVMRRHEGVAPAVEFVRRFLGEHADAALWAEEPLPKRSDPFWQTWPNEDRGWFCGEEVFSLAFEGDDNERLEQVLSSIWEYPGWGGAGFLSPATARKYQHFHDLDEATLATVAAQTEYLICGAFDGEGYVVWEPA